MKLRYPDVNATQINANLVGKDFRIMEISAKERVTFQNRRN